jgi:hypothetical protein
MKYEKPKCDCREELYIYSWREREDYYKITKDGRMSSKPFIIGTDHANPSHWGFLECLKCGNKYEIDWNKNIFNGKYLRGELIL